MRNEKKQREDRKLSLKKKSKLNITLSNKTQKILLYSTGIIMVILAYTLVFTNVQASNETLQAQVNQLQVKRQEMKEMVEQEQNNQSAIKTMENEIDDMLSQFPEDVKEEDIIMYADSLEAKTNMSIYDITFTSKNVLWTPESDEKSNSLDYAYYLYSSPATYSFTVGYQDVKKVLSEIQNHEDMKNVERILLSYDSQTGLLNGELLMNSYSIEGGIRSYDSPKIPDMSVGTNNVFNTIQ